MSAAEIPCLTCGHLACVCRVLEEHPDPACRYRIAVTCAAPIACEHGWDACPKCDPCTCKPKGNR